MRLLIVSGAYPPMASGEAANAQALARRLAGRGVDVHVLTERGRHRDTGPGVRVEAAMPGWSWRHLPRLAGALRRIRPDAVLLMYLGGMYDQHPMMTFAPTVIRRVLGDVTVATRFENPLSPARPGLHGLHVRLLRKLAAAATRPGRVPYSSGTLLAHSDRVIVLCGYHLSLLAEEDPTVRERATVIPPPANVTVRSDATGTFRRAGREAFDVPPDRILLGYLGYVYENKGVDSLLRAVAAARASGADLDLAVMGGSVDAPGMDPEYVTRMQALARRLGIGDRVRWTGAFAADDERLPSWVHAADLFVLPFDNGVHLNNSSVSSLAGYGKPMVLTRADHTDADFVHGENAHLVPPSDVEALAEAIRCVPRRPEYLQHLGRGASRLARERFSWDRALDDTLATLQSGGASR